MVLHEEFDELLTERRERANGLDHASGFIGPGVVGESGAGDTRGAETPQSYRLSALLA
jgi:hypothetical protein